MKRILGLAICVLAWALFAPDGWAKPTELKSQGTFAEAGAGWHGRSGSRGGGHTIANPTRTGTPPRFGHPRNDPHHPTKCRSCFPGSGGGPGDVMPPTHLTFNRRTTAPSITQEPVAYRTGRGPQVEMLLTYSTASLANGSFANKWNFYYDSFYSVLPSNDVEITDPAGRKMTFTYNSGSYDPPHGCLDSLVKNQDNSYTFEDYYTGVKYTYGASSQKIESIEDVWGETVTVSRDENGYLASVTDANSRSCTFLCDANGRVTKITDPISNEATFLYDNDTSELTKIVDIGGSSYTFEYGADSYLTKYTSPEGTSTFTYVVPDYDPEGTWGVASCAYLRQDGHGLTVYWPADQHSYTYVQVKAPDGRVIRSYNPSAGSGITDICLGENNGDGDFLTYLEDDSGFTTKIGVRRDTGQTPWQYTTYYLDDSHRITKTTLPDGQQMTYAYDGNGVVTRKVLPNGAYRDYLYDSHKVLTKITHEDSSTEEFCFDDSGLRTKYVDRWGQTSTYGYNTYGYMTGEVAPGNRSWTYDNDLVGRVTRVTNPDSVATDYAYDVYGKATIVTYVDNSYEQYEYTCCALTKHTDRGGRATAFYVNPYGSITKVTDAENRSTSYLYDTLDYCTKVTDPLGRQTKYDYDITQGKLTKVTYPNNLAATWDYDVLGNLTTYTDVVGSAANYYYTYADRLTKGESHGGCVYYYYDTYDRVTATHRSLVGYSYAEYDGYDRLTKATDTRGANTVYVYDGASRLTQVTDHIGASASWVFDEMGQVVTLTNPDGGSTTTAYDILGRVTKVTGPEGGDTVYAWNDLGLLTSVTRPEGGQTTFDYDASGWTTKETDPTSRYAYYYLDNTRRLTKAADGLSNAWVVAYDLAGNLTKVTDPNAKAVTYYVSNVDLVTKVTDGIANNWTYEYSTAKGYLTKASKPNGKATCLLYDGYGRLTRWRQYLQEGDPTAYDIWDHQQRYWYDELDRMTKKSDYYESGYFDSGSGWENHVLLTRPTYYSYDLGSAVTRITYPNSVTADYGYDTLGRRTRATATGSDLTWAYDPQSRLTGAVYSYDSGTLTRAVAYAYDKAYRRTKTVDGEGTNVVYSYDGERRLVSVTEGGNTRGTYTYDAAGRRLTLALGNGSYAQYVYDSAGRLTGVLNKKSDTSDVSTFLYTLDPAGMRTKMDIAGSAYTSASVAYLYDGAYQLTRETRTGGNAYTQYYYYDNSGNRTKSNLGGTNTVYSYDYIDRMTQYGSTALLWDAWGNVTKVGANDSYYWDDADRLTKYDGSGTANDTTYAYAPGSWKRVKRTISGSTMYFGWDGANLQAEYLSDGSVSQRFLTVGLDDELSTTNGDGTKYYLHDGLGSVRNLVDSSETVRNTYDTRAFGQDQGTQTSGVTNPFRYTGAYDDSWESAQGPVYYLRNRYYLPGVGLFASRDRGKFDLARRWGYVGNNPVVRTDPFGQNWFTDYWEAAAAQVGTAFQTASEYLAQLQRTLAYDATDASVIFSVGPVDAWNAMYIYRPAAETFGDIHRDKWNERKGNALRHCMGACLLHAVSGMSEEEANAVLGRHEMGRPWNFDTKDDMWNNTMGSSFGQRAKRCPNPVSTCAKLCRSALAKGLLALAGSDAEFDEWAGEKLAEFE